MSQWFRRLCAWMNNTSILHAGVFVIRGHPSTEQDLGVLGLFCRTGSGCKFRGPHSQNVFPGHAEKVVVKRRKLEEKRRRSQVPAPRLYLMPMTHAPEMAPENWRRLLARLSYNLVPNFSGARFRSRIEHVLFRDRIWRPRDQNTDL